MTAQIHLIGVEVLNSDSIKGHLDDLIAYLCI